MPTPLPESLASKWQFARASRGQQSFIELTFVDFGARRAYLDCSAFDPACIQPEWQTRRVHYPLIGAN